jgi:hypothetical protein
MAARRLILGNEDHSTDMDQPAKLLAPAPRLRREVSGRQTLAAIAVLVSGLVGVTGLMGALAKGNCVPSTARPPTQPWS